MSFKKKKIKKSSFKQMLLRPKGEGAVAEPHGGSPKSHEV